MSPKFSQLAQLDVIALGSRQMPEGLTAILFGLVCTGGTVVTRLLVDIVAPTAGPFALIYPAVLISTLFGRWRSGGVTYVTLFLWTWFVVVPDHWSFHLARASDGPRMAVNAATVLVVLAFAELFRRAIRAADRERTHKQRELERRETGMRMALEAGRFGSWTLDIVTRKLTASEACRTLFGRAPDQPFGYAELLSSIHPEDRTRMEAAVERSVATRTPYEIEYRIVTPQEELRWVQIRAEVVEGAAGGLCLTGISMDVTDQKLSEARRDALGVLADAFRDLADPDEIAFAASSLLGQALGVSRVGYGAIEPQAETLLVKRDWTEPGIESLAGSLHLREFGSFIDSLRHGEVVAIADVRADVRTADAAQALEAINTRAFVNVPVVENGQLVAVLYLNNAQVRTWSSEDISLIREIADRTHMASERISTSIALREANETLEVRIQARTQDLMQAEEALRQAQKMEAVGQLTGGIAHDFNNLLAGISGSLELLDARVQQGRLGELDRYISAAQGAAKRAASLTQRLLAFSRRQTLDPRPTDINKLVTGMEDLLRRSVGPTVEVEVVGAGGLWTAKIDASQLENALLNLCINARDAMAPDGGRLTIETANKWLDQHAAKDRDLPPGQYVSVCVTDTGTGMDTQVMARAFDPFYTTKPLGQGTGLGLSMVYGFARQSGGQVRIYSELGKGTTMCLYFPRFAGAAEQGLKDESPTAEPGAGETVLVIDDEPTIRMLITDVLGELGYGALQAEDGPSGLRILQSDVRIDLLITDVGLPGGMNGRQIADAARVARPDLKVLFITGYAENAVVGNGHLDMGMEVITKPFVMNALAAKVRALIDARAPSKT